VSDGFNAQYFLDAVGRRRKLSAGSILAIQREFRRGAKTADLAESYGVSTSLIRTITYNTPREADQAKIDAARAAWSEARADLVQSSP
jgi:hypothetical protein